MNATTARRLTQSIISFALVGALGLIPLAAAEQTCNNPLRPVRRPVVKSQTPAQTASAIATAATEGQRTAPAQQTPVYRQVSYGANAQRHSTRGYVPRHELMGGMSTAQMLAPIEQDPSMSLEPLPAEGEIMGDMGGISGPCGDAGAPCDSCDSCGYNHGCLIPCPVFSLRNVELFSGVQGFTGPMNQGSSGSFGFHYGLNWGAPMPCLLGGAVGMQVGFRGVSSNYSGSTLTTDTRNQQFLTAGLFRRVDWGLQGGVVFDYLRDDWYYDSNLTQIRGELSWVFPACHELGFWFTARGRSDTVTTSAMRNGQVVQQTATLEPFDLFAFFYRRRFESLGGGAARVYAGFTGNSDGLVGADIKMPLTENWALQSAFTYVIPDESNKQIAFSEEAWNVGITLVWYPGQRKSVGNDYFRPLFDVADNGSFIARIK